MAQPCCGCGNAVFPAEKLVLNGKFFHKSGCAKCGVCHANLTAKNLYSVNGDDKSLWTCQLHKNSVPGTAGPAASHATPQMKKASSATAEKFAAYLKRNLQEEEGRRYGTLASKIRKSLRKQTTKEVITTLTEAKQQELAAFVEEFRREANTSQSQPKTIMQKTTPANPPTTSPPSTSRFNRAIRSIRLPKPASTSPSYSTKPSFMKAQSVFKQQSQNQSRPGMQQARAVFQRS